MILEGVILTKEEAGDSAQKGQKWESHEAMSRVSAFSRAASGVEHNELIESTYFIRAQRGRRMTSLERYLSTIMLKKKNNNLTAKNQSFPL